MASNQNRNHVTGMFVYSCSIVDKLLIINSLHVHSHACYEQRPTKKISHHGDGDDGEQQHEPV